MDIIDSTMLEEKGERSMQTYADTKAQTWQSEASPCLAMKCWARRAIVGGVVSGLVFISFQMFFCWLVKGSFFEPMRLISAMVMSRNAVEAWYPLLVAVPYGVAVHLVLSVLFAGIFTAFVVRHPFFAASFTRLVFIACVYGFLLWIINFYCVATLVGWSWFPDRTDPFFQGFIAHVFLYGAVLGVYLNGRLR